MNNFPNSTPRASTGSDEDWTGPLFIIGMPRSGTKLLRGLLEQHPRIRVPTIETDFFPFLQRWVRERGSPADETAFERLFQEFKNAPYFMQRPAGMAPFSWREWREHCRGRYDAAGLFEGFIRYETGIGAQPGYIWGDKSPAYTRHVATLLQHFPQARVVHIVRDVRDYCLSIRKAWNKDIRRAAFQWGRDVGHAHRICKQHAQRCIELKYEDLLQAPEQRMRDLSAFLQIDFSDAMTRLERPVEVHGASAGAGRAEVVSGNSQKFVTGLSVREIRAIESLAWDSMQLLGYRPLHAVRQKQLSALQLHALRVKDAIRLVTRSARRDGLAGTLRFHLSHVRVAD